MFNKDVATGMITITDGYSTKGPSSTFHIKNEIPSFPQPACYILHPETCTEEQYAAVKNGSAIIKDFMKMEGSAIPGGTKHSDSNKDGQQRIFNGPSL